MNPSCSVCCFSDASGVLYPLRVASCRCGPSTRSLWPPPRCLPACRGSGTVGCSRWRAQQHAFVEKLEHAFRLMFVCRTWNLPPRDADNRRIEVVADGLPLFHWRPACHRHHARLSTVKMVQPSASVPELMVQPWSKPDDAKNAPIQSWRRCTVEHGWLSWRAKSAAGRQGQRSARRVQGLGEKGMDDEVVFVVGVYSSKSSCPFPCWTTDALPVAMAYHSCH